MKDTPELIQSKPDAEVRRWIESSKLKALLKLRRITRHKSNWRIRPLLEEKIAERTAEESRNPHWLVWFASICGFAALVISILGWLYPRN